MGESSRDRFGKRQRAPYGGEKSSSDSELAQSKNRGRKAKTKERWPLFDGLTVDELARYRRRRVQGQPKDNVGLCPESEPLEEDDLLSEYRRAFRTSSEDISKENIWPRRGKKLITNLRLEGSFENFEPSYRHDFKGYDKKEFPTPKKNLFSSSLVLADDSGAMETKSERCKVPHANSVGRAPIIRRGTSLKREGNIYTDTETYSAYVPHEGQHRPELARRPTSLKMEGEMDTMTEKCEKFIQWLNVSRPELMRVPTNLKLEGKLETTTENHEKYVPFVGARRPELLKRSTNLKFEGESTFIPEYLDVFREHNVAERRSAKKPQSHLKLGENFFRTTENSDNVTLNSRAKEAQLMAELTKDVEEEEEEKKRKKEERAKKDKEIQMLVSQLEGLKNPPLEIPEYKAAYKDFPRERPKLVKPEDEIGRADGSKIPSSPGHSKFSKKIDQDPEYKSKYLDYPKDSFSYRKPPLALRSTGGSCSRLSETRRFDQETTTSEVRSQYIPYGYVPRVKTLRIPTSLRLEGNLDLQPEYRNAYCKRDPSLECRKYKGRDTSPSGSTRRANYWLNNNNSERFGAVNAAEEQGAFQVLNTRIHEDSVVGKPPPGSRRGSRASQSQVQRPSQLNIGEPSSLRNRSPSPTYRLHVCNVDDEPRGFGQRRRSSQHESSKKWGDSLLDRLNQNENRPYSPSFARNSKQQINGTSSFVVLDNEAMIKSNERERRRRKMENDVSVSRRPRTPTNWMPPWYDSTNTI